MKLERSLLPHALVLSLAVVFAIGLAGYVLASSNAVKSDKALNKTASDVADSLNNYTGRSGTAPASLAAAYKKPLPATIRYQKLSSNSYKLCVTYRTKDTGAYGWFDFAATGLPDQSHQQTTLYLSDVHDSGQNCYTVDQLSTSFVGTDNANAAATPQALTDPKQQAIASGSQDTVCGQPGFPTHYAATVQSVKTADGKPLVPTVTQDLIVVVEPETDGAHGSQTINMPKNSFNVFNSACTAQNYQSLQPGDQISVFLNNPEPYSIGQIVDFSQRT